MKKALKFGVSFLVIAVLAVFTASNLAKASPPPTLDVTTSGATNVSKASATLNGSVGYLSGTPTISEWGFDYGITTDYESTVIAGGDPVVGDFSVSVSGLSCGTTYHVRAYSIPVIITYSKPRFLLALLFSVAHASPPPQKSVGSDITFITSPCSSDSHRSYHGATTVTGQVANLIAIGNPQLAEKIASEYSAPLPSVVATSSVVFERDLRVGSVGTDVKMLQHYLNGKGVMVAAEGPGSVGNETTYFGSATKKALMQFQKAMNIVPALGYCGSLTRTYIQSH